MSSKETPENSSSPPPPLPRKIRLRYAGLVAFLARLLSVGTGLVFIVLVTSRLSVSDFGTWQLISKVIGYCTFPAIIVNFWVVRYTARSIIVGRTSFLWVFLLSTISSGVYLLIAYSLSTLLPNSSLVFYFFLLAMAQVFLYGFTGVVESIASGIAPERAAYGFLVFEVAKVFLGGLLVALLTLSLRGAILAVAFAQGVQAIYLAVYLKPEFSDKFNFSIVKNWMKHSWLSGLIQIHSLIITLDFTVVALLSASSKPLGYYGAASTVAIIVSYASWIATALYPKLLAGGSFSDVKQTLDLVIIFLIPMALGAGIMAPQLLSILQHAYIDAVPILHILVGAWCANTVYQVADSTLAGTDKLELNERVTFSDYRKSRLFIVVKTNLLLSIAYIGGLFAISPLYVPGSYVRFGEYWALVFLSANLAAGTLKLWYARKLSSFPFPMGKIAKSLVAAVPLSILLFVGQHYIPLASVAPRLVVVAEVLAIGLTAVAVYAIVLYAIDPSFKDLAKRVVWVLKNG